jgi:hypothetical protein
MAQPIGELLVAQGVITSAECRRVLEHQRVTGRPFGEIAEEMLGISGRSVEAAWAEQYAQTTKWIDPTMEYVDPAVRELITRRQAWQFGILPMGYEGVELTVCTTQVCLVRAMNFAVRSVPATCYYVLTEPDQLFEALMRHYPMDGMTPSVLETAASRMEPTEATQRTRRNRR